MFPKFSSTVVVLFFLPAMVWAQKLTIETKSGMNFSNIHGDLRSGKWSAQPGPVAGLSAKLSLGKKFMLQSGADFLTQYYHLASKQYYYTDYLYSSHHVINSPPATSPDIYYPHYARENWKYSFLRIPLLLKFKTQGRLNFEMGAGPWYSFFMNDEFTGIDKDLFSEEYIDENFPPPNDWGWIFSAGLNYEIADRLVINLSGQTGRGKEVYIDEAEGKTGATEITFGLGYKLFPAKHNPAANKEINDTTKSRIVLLPHAGVIVSTTKNPKFHENYLNASGVSSGMSVKIKLDNTVSIITGTWFERKGYGLEYTGEKKFIYEEPRNDDFNSFVDTETDLDYLIFPLLFELNFGNKFSANLNFGFYYSCLQNAMVRGDYTFTHTTGNSYSVKNEYVYDKITGWFKNNDIGATGGIRFEYPVFSKSNVFVGISYSKGLKNILDYNYEDHQIYGRNEKIVNSSFAVNFGITIPTLKTTTL